MGWISIIGAEKRGVCSNNHFEWRGTYPRHHVAVVHCLHVSRFIQSLALIKINSSIFQNWILAKEFNWRFLKDILAAYLTLSLSFSLFLGFVYSFSPLLTNWMDLCGNDVECSPSLPVTARKHDSPLFSLAKFNLCCRSICGFIQLNCCCCCCCCVYGIAFHNYGWE